MSLRARDIEALYKKYGAEEASKRAIMLLGETMIAQQQAMFELAKTIDGAGAILERLAGATEALFKSEALVRRRLGIDIDDKDAGSEPITTMRRDSEHEH